MLRHEQTAVAQFTDLTPQPPSILHNLPGDVEGNVLSFLETVDLVQLSESSLRGMSGPARDLLREMAVELRKFLADNPLMQELMQELMQGTSKPFDVSVGQVVLQLRWDLKGGLEKLDNLRAKELVSLRDSIRKGLSQSQRPSQQRALQLIKAEFLRELGRRMGLVPELRNDREIVLAAVQADLRPLAYASAELRNDRGVVSIQVLSEFCLRRYDPVTT